MMSLASAGDAHTSPCSHRFAEDDDLRRIERLVQARFDLGGAPVRVEQLATTEPGFPPLETRFEFWTGNNRRHAYRVFRPACEVSAADLPPWWYKDALILDDYPHCDCCG